MANVRKVRRVFTRPAASEQQPINLKQRFALTGIIRRMILTLQGSQISTGGGAISAFGREAPWPLISRLEIVGNYRPKDGQARVAFNAPPADLYWPMNFLAGSIGEILIASAGASSTDPIRGVIPIIWADPGSLMFDATMLDSRDYTSLDMNIDWAADAVLAATNLSSVTGLNLEVYIEEIVGPGLPPVGWAHYEPFFIQKTHPASTQDTELTDDSEMKWDGLVNVAHFQQNDDSAVGNLERVNGLVRILAVDQGSKPIIPRTSIQSLLRDTQEEYPLALTTTQPDGVYAVKAEPTWDSKKGVFTVKRDTQSAVPAGFTAVTPAAGDYIKTTLIGGSPNPALREALASA